MLSMVTCWVYLLSRCYVGGDIDALCSYDELALIRTRSEMRHCFMREALTPTLTGSNILMLDSCKPTSTHDGLCWGLIVS